MDLSIITPTHDSRWLLQTLDSLEAQTYEGDWEWIVVPNGEAQLPQAIVGHPNVLVVPYPSEGSRFIGALKRFCCEQAQGNIIVELDHDDMLTRHALQTVMAQFDGADLIYSNCAEFQDGTWEPHVYDLAHGWETREREFYGRQFTEIRSFPPTGQSHAIVHYAPNHLRAWRQEAYWDVGGHDQSMEVADDHDLVARFYLKKQVRLIDDCLYLYRLHGDNSYLARNAAVQQATKRVRDKYVWQLAERWADLEGLPKVDLGAAHDKPTGYIGLDLAAGPGVDIIKNVAEGLPFEDGSVGLIRASDFLEHIPDSVSLMNEIWRVLVDGGWLLSSTPSSDGRGAFQDPTHVAFWNENSWWYYTNRFYAAYVPEVACRFQAVRVKTAFRWLSG